MSLTDSSLFINNATNGTIIQCKLISNAFCPSPAEVNSSPVTISHPKVSITGKLAFCKNSSTLLTGNGADTYAWSNGQKTSSITVDSPGIYSVIGTSKSGCSDTANAQTVTLPLPVISLPKHLEVFQSERLPLSPAVSGNPPFKYQWTPNYAISNDSIASPFIQPHFNTTYTLTVTDRNGCLDISSINISMIGFYIYPNPAKDNISIYGAGISIGTYHLRLINAGGTEMYSEKLNINTDPFTKQISVKKLAAGLYFLVLEGQNSSTSFSVIKM